MIIERSSALALVDAGSAREVTLVNWQADQYVAIDRFDAQRVDHYLALPEDVCRMELADAYCDDFSQFVECIDPDAVVFGSRAEFEASDISIRFALAANVIRANRSPCLKSGGAPT